MEHLGECSIYSAPRHVLGKNDKITFCVISLKDDLVVYKIVLISFVGLYIYIYGMVVMATVYIIVIIAILWFLYFLYLVCVGTSKIKKSWYPV